MKSRPLIFTAESVRAILTGSKTQTRRLVRHIPALGFPEEWADRAGTAELARIVGDVAKFCPHGEPGGRIWVKEAHAQFAVGNKTGISPQCVAYRATCDADGGFEYVNNGNEVMRLKVTKWSSPLYMPRWASRITLEITEVRVQRLHDITEDDARAEGVERDTSPCDHTRLSCEEIGCLGQTYRAGYCEAWCSIHGDDAWQKNPLVWAISFRRITHAIEVAR